MSTDIGDSTADRFDTVFAADMETTLAEVACWSTAPRTSRRCITA